MARKPLERCEFILILRKKVHLIGEEIKNIKMSFLIKITVGQSSMHFFTSLLFKNYQFLRNDGSFSSLNIFRKLHYLNFLNSFLLF